MNLKIQSNYFVAFRLTPQPGVPPKEAGVVVAAQSSSAYPLDLFEEGFSTNMFTSIVGNVLGSKPCVLYVWKIYESQLLILKPSKARHVASNRAVYDCLRGGLDFTKDDENVNSQPFMRWRDRFLFCAEAIYKAQAETGEIKGHYLNATTGRFTANTSLAHYCQDNGLLLHIHYAMHAIIDRQKNHCMHFRVLAKTLCLSGGDHIHVGTVVGKLEGERDITLGFVDYCMMILLKKNEATAFISLKIGSL
ncbi:hypothetical protein ACH5RR_012966 [Cinchona calisaya]|uniref:Ribulose bisphosphate carboxylase large chain n=1 Tax=Cinchona calisaya TaxID=153742 RepID=A0ABD2ZYR0_9GENT